MVVATPTEASDYFEAMLEPALKPALVALCRARPANPIVWLAEYMLENKPQPPVVSITAFISSRHDWAGIATQVKVELWLWEVSSQVLGRVVLK